MAKLVVGIGGTGTDCLGALASMRSSKCVILVLDTSAPMATCESDAEPQQREAPVFVSRKEANACITELHRNFLMRKRDAFRRMGRTVRHEWINALSEKLMQTRIGSLRQKLIQNRINALREKLKQKCISFLREKLMQKLYREPVCETNVHGKMRFGRDVSTEPDWKSVHTGSLLAALVRAKSVQFDSVRFRRSPRSDGTGTANRRFSEPRTRRRMRLMHRRIGMSESGSLHLHDKLSFTRNVCAETNPIKLCMDGRLRNRESCSHMSKFVFSPALLGEIGSILMPSAA